MNFEMDIGMYVALDSIGSIVLLIICWDYYKNKTISNRFDDQTFIIMIFVNIGLLLTDMFGWALIGKQFPYARVLNIVITAIYYILHPVMCMTWLLYCEFKLTNDEPKIRKKIPLYALPLWIIVILTLASCFRPCIFWIDAQNIYYRENIFILFALLCMIYPVYAAILTIQSMAEDKKQRNLRRNLVLLIYPCLPLLVIIVGFLFFGVTIFWLGAVFSILLIYFNLQNSKITTDPLTSLNNRRRYEVYIDSKIHSQRRYPILFLLLIDIDRLKYINDNFGHMAGDEAIKWVASILIRKAPWSDFIARISGDEFVIIGERNNKKDVLSTIDSFQEGFIQFNKEQETPYPLSVSIGYSLIRDGEVKSSDDLFAEADKMMYMQKELKHEKKFSPKYW